MAATPLKTMISKYGIRNRRGTAARLLPSLGVILQVKWLLLIVTRKASITAQTTHGQRASSKQMPSQPSTFELAGRKSLCRFSHRTVIIAITLGQIETNKNSR